MVTTVEQVRLVGAQLHKPDKTGHFSPDKKNPNHQLNLRRLWRRQVEAALGFSQAIKKVVQAANRARIPKALAYSPARLQLNPNFY